MMNIRHKLADLVFWIGVKFMNLAERLDPVAFDVGEHIILEERQLDDPKPIPPRKPRDK